MATHTSEELLQHYIDAMGDELGRMFHRFFNETAHLHVKWLEYVALFGTSEERVQLLNSAAPGFFRLVQDTLWDDVLLHICRLADECRVGRRSENETLSLHWLSQLADAPEISQEVKKRLTALRTATEFARAWRDNHIAHRNRQLALRDEAESLPVASRQKVKEAIAAIVAVMAVVETHYCGTAPTSYNHVSQRGSAESVLYLLREGMDARSSWVEHLKAGNLQPSELTTMNRAL